jgi:hypothetical protein
MTARRLRGDLPRVHPIRGLRFLRVPVALVLLVIFAAACEEHEERPACGVLVDSTSYAVNVPVNTWIGDLRPYLYKQSCASVSYAVITANAAATACRGAAVQIDPEGQMEGPERDDFRNRQLARAVDEAKKILACGENEVATRGYSDVVGALRTLASDRDEQGRAPTHIIAFSDFAHRTQRPRLDLTRVALAGPRDRKQIIDGLRKQGTLPRLTADTDILTQRFGAFIDPKNVERAAAFHEFWQELFAASGGPHVTFD